MIVEIADNGTKFTILNGKVWCSRIRTYIRTSGYLQVAIKPGTYTNLTLSDLGYGACDSFVKFGG